MPSFNESWALLALGLSVIVVRIVMRLATMGRRLAADDFLMLVAALLFIAEVVLAYSVNAWWLGMANNGYDDETRASYAKDPLMTRLIIGGSKTQIAGQNTYTALLWTLKMAVCSFYSRLTHDLAGYKYRIRVAFGFIFVSWFTVHMTLMAGCFPFYKYWQFYPNPGNSCQAAVSRVFILTCFVLDIMTDAYLLSIPLPMLWRTDLPRPKKIGLSVVFSGAAFVMVAALLRCYFIMTDSKEGASQSGEWACRETFVALVTSNVPVIWSCGRILLGPRGRLAGSLPSIGSWKPRGTDSDFSSKTLKHGSEASASSASTNTQEGSMV
ncbi:hypothetical protein PG993_014162 [Apiospora rasikravindrae]|uniref:Rhodopsin domain-containing protein n=1 Tax=Apiospora rasikravindrae TaxID=990691 RepID=A0ABR1RS97_9PEZI